MKNVVSIFLVMYFQFSISLAAENIPIHNQVQEIYNICNDNIPQVQTVNVRQGNIDDITRENKLRQCLKNKTIQIAASYLPETKLEDFRNALETLEKTGLTIYSLLIFCQDKEQPEWCRQRMNDEMSLGRLLLEKNLTAQIMHILTDVLNSKQGGYRF